MKNWMMIAAAGVVLVANAATLIHAARNRSGQPQYEVTLTDRDLLYQPSPENSGVELRLRWGRSERQFQESKIKELGFDVSMPASNREAWAFYQRQRARAGFVALDYSGSEVKPDAALDREVLRAKHKGNDKVVILPVVFHVRAMSRGVKDIEWWVDVWMSDLPDVIHVPKPFSDTLKRLGPGAAYTVTLRYGPYDEPWVVGAAAK